MEPLKGSRFPNNWLKMHRHLMGNNDTNVVATEAKLIRLALLPEMIEKATIIRLDVLESAIHAMGAQMRKELRVNA